MNQENIREVELGDLDHIQEISRLCWLETYVIDDFLSANGRKYSVSKSDIETFFNNQSNKPKDYLWFDNVKSNPDKHYLVADNNGVIGFSYGYKLSESKKDIQWISKQIQGLADLDSFWYIRTLYIHPNSQGMGYGSLLLKNQIDTAKSRDSKGVILGVNEYNQKAIDLYKRTGFEIISEPFDLVFGDDNFKITKPVSLARLEV